MKVSSTFSIWVFVILALFQSTIVSGAGAPEVATSSNTDTDNADTEPGSEGVITLTSRNFDSSISDGNVWLIQFHSISPVHCLLFLFL